MKDINQLALVGRLFPSVEVWREGIERLLVPERLKYTYFFNEDNSLTVFKPLDVYQTKMVLPFEAHFAISLELQAYVIALTRQGLNLLQLTVSQTKIGEPKRYYPLAKEEENIMLLLTVLTISGEIYGSSSNK